MTAPKYKVYKDGQGDYQPFDAWRLSSDGSDHQHAPLEGMAGWPRTHERSGRAGTAIKGDSINTRAPCEIHIAMSIEAGHVRYDRSDGAL
jgi:hypothetical protein